MKVLYYDCFAGISGDMNLGALIDAGVPAEYLVNELGKLKVEGYQVEVSSALKMGISGTLVSVNLEQHTHSPDEGHGHGHGHSHGAKHIHRNLKDIERIIDASTLNDFVKEKSKAMFLEIARAEAKIHAKTIQDIHFHEVGAIDSIIDVVGSAICIDYLKPDKIIASTVELGGGFVKCAHGLFPVPAPATAEILKDIPVKKGKVDKETTTPTGAAILKVFVDEFLDQTHFTIDKIAYGIGHRELEIPNVLRVYLGKHEESQTFDKADALMIECNIDDMNPEHYDYVMKSLFEHGAHDVFMVPIIMKKSRPAIQLKVLCNPHDKEKMETVILNETTSIGIRAYPVSKSMMERKVRTIDTRFGPIRIKEAQISGKTLKFKAEYDDCAAVARKTEVSLQEVYKEVDRCMEKLK